MIPAMRFAADHPLQLAPATPSDYREHARRRLPRQIFDYIDGGAGEEATMRANVVDLEAISLRQIVMRDVAVRDPGLEVLGRRLALPVALAPVGLGGMFARRAEVQAARAAEAAGVPFVESTVSICSVEEVAEATTTPPWFQLYVMRDRDYAESLMARADAVGAPVLMLTIDLAVVGARHRDTRNAMVGNPSGWAKARRALDLVSHPRWVGSVAIGGRPLTFGNLEQAVPGAKTPEAFKVWVDSQFDPSVTWTTSPGCGATGPGGSWSRGCSIPKTPAGRPTRASTVSSSPTTGAASSTRPPPPRGRCPRSPQRSETRWRCSPTAASGRAPTS